MQQKQMMILVAVLVVVVIAIVAVVLLMGNKPATGPAPGGNTGGGLPPAGGGGLPTGGTDIPAAMAAGSPVECTITSTESGVTTTMNLKMEAPSKVRMEIASGGVQSTVLSNDAGQNVYMSNPQTGGWIKFTSDTAPEQQNMDPNEIRDSYNNPPAGVTYNCRVVGDIPDSNFAPPAGAQIQDMSDLLGAYGGAGGYPGA